MLKKFFINKIKEYFQNEPTAGQIVLLDKISEFVLSKDDNELFLLKGYAGTGKTSIIAALVKTLDEFEFNSILLAPTGRAAKVLNSYAEKTAFTIHKKIYRQKSLKDINSKFVLDRNLHKDTIFIVDEASMISNANNDASIFGSGRLLNDLIKYVYNDKNCKLILVGDTAQLPPVGIAISPALDKPNLELYDKKVIDVILTDVVRQTLDSGILTNATALRKLIKESENKIESLDFPKILLNDFQDVKKITGEELIEEITNCYHQFGTDETMIVCRSNKRANKYNEGIRKSILWRDAEIAKGDMLMVVKNSYHWVQSNEKMDFIANGDIAEIIKIYKYEERYNYRYADVCMRFIDYDITVDVKIMLDTLAIETASLPTEAVQELFFKICEDYAELNNKKLIYEKVREDKFFNALQVKFAYAVTCHKSQGGQWQAVFIDQNYITKELIDIEYLRWLYTAFTRSSKKLYLVNFKKDFFE